MSFRKLLIFVEDLAQLRRELTFMTTLVALPHILAQLGTLRDSFMHIGEPMESYHKKKSTIDYFSRAVQRGRLIIL